METKETFNWIHDETINKNKEFATYRKHYTDYAEGHIFLNKEGACTIHLEGACSMKQEELDNYAKIMIKALNTKIK